MRVVVASDHAGFCQKADIIAFVRGLGHEVEDLGPATDDRVDYPDFADVVARRVGAGTADRGILICGTGLGMEGLAFSGSPRYLTDARQGASRKENVRPWSRPRKGRT